LKRRTSRVKNDLKTEFLVSFLRRALRGWLGLGPELKVAEQQAGES